jgi:hypothetical protein
MHGSGARRRRPSPRGPTHGSTDYIKWWSLKDGSMTWIENLGVRPVLILTARYDTRRRGQRRVAMPSPAIARVVKLCLCGGGGHPQLGFNGCGEVTTCSHDAELIFFKLSDGKGGAPVVLRLLSFVRWRCSSGELLWWLVWCGEAWNHLAMAAAWKENGGSVLMVKGSPGMGFYSGWALVWGARTLDRF